MLEFMTANSRRTSLLVGAFLALVCVCYYSLVGFASVVSIATPYLAGIGMFAGLLSIFGTIIFTLKKIRKSARKEAAIFDCYIAIAVIGVAGYFLAACVQTFQPNGNPAELWIHGAASAAAFAFLFTSGSWLRDLFNAGGAK